MEKVHCGEPGVSPAHGSENTQGTFSAGGSLESKALNLWFLPRFFDFLEQESLKDLLVEPFCQRIEIWQNGRGHRDGLRCGVLVLESGPCDQHDHPF